MRSGGTGGSEMAKSTQKLTTLADGSLGDPQLKVEGKNQEDMINLGKHYFSLGVQFDMFSILFYLKKSIYRICAIVGKV